ncbi:MAG: GNAT family N-acetyltransferase [Verrucomicrobia subdivision 3 bacterium]|nr:GNAT family N-acetyltransferase [Limisphaerales bacterium]
MDQQYEVSTDPARLDMRLIHGFLRSSYWARNIPRCTVERSIRNALCFGAYCGSEQVAFARVISDFATFAYIGDVFVVPKHRGRGLSKLLMRAILDHPELQGLRRWLLATKDAQGLYAQFGFKPVSNIEDFMTIHNPDIYASPQIQ